MDRWGNTKGMNEKAKADETKKRRKEDEPDGAASATLQYLKNGFLPTDERLKADEKYERDQERKKREQKNK